MEDSNKKIYEIGYHILPNLSEDEAMKVVADMKEQLLKAGAEMIAEQNPSMMTLAYEVGKEIENKIRRFETAYFGWMKFEVETKEIEGITSAMDKNPSILRHLIIKTVRESTLAQPKLAHKGMSRRATPEAGAPMDEAAVDKKIDEMVEADAAVVAPAADLSENA